MRQEVCSSALVNSNPAAAVGQAGSQQRQRRIEAFNAAVRPAVAKVMGLGPRFEDLADSFPALLFALATGYGAEPARRATVAAVGAGAPLKEIAQILGLPFWVRKLPPSAFVAPLGSVPAEPQLVARLVSLIPSTPAAAAAWLDRVLVAHATGRAELTLWVAQQYRSAMPSARSASFLSVLAWSWFGVAGKEQRAERLLTERWKAGMSARRAGQEARLWRERIALDVCLGRGIEDTWLTEATVAEFSFTALRTADDFFAEARAMDNCLDRYADKLEGRVARVFSIRRDGRSIANIEISAHDREPGHPVITQLRGPHNRRAPLEVWQAAYAWLGSQPLRLADKGLEVRASRAAKERRQAEIWTAFVSLLPPHAREAFLTTVLGRRKRSAARSSSRRPSSGS